MSNTINTRDLGLAIRDFLENRSIAHFAENEHGDLDEFPEVATVDYVDVSDPNNLRVSTDTGQWFTVRISSR